MTEEPYGICADLAVLLDCLKMRYCWVRMRGTATEPLRVIRWAMDFGVEADCIDLERVTCRKLLIEALTTAPAGALRSRSWCYWHYRLGVTSADHEPPPLPRRTFLGPSATLGHLGYDRRPCVKGSDRPVEGSGTDGPPRDRLAYALRNVLVRVDPGDYRAVVAHLRSGVQLADGLARALDLFRPAFPIMEAARALTDVHDAGLATLPDVDRRLLREAVVRRAGSCTQGDRSTSKHSR